jgi:hypothetical protein
MRWYLFGQDKKLMKAHRWANCWSTNFNYACIVYFVYMEFKKSFFPLYHFSYGNKPNVQYLWWFYECQTLSSLSKCTKLFVDVFLKLN